MSLELQITLKIQIPTLHGPGPSGFKDVLTVRTWSFFLEFGKFGRGNFLARHLQTRLSHRRNLRSENLTFEARHQGTTLVPGPLGATTITGRQHQTARVDGMYIYIYMYYTHNNNLLIDVNSSFKKHIMCSGYCYEYEDRRKHILDLGDFFFVICWIEASRPMPPMPI